MGGEVFRTLQTRPGAHPASCTMGAGFAPEVKRWGVALNTHAHLVLRLKKE